jgi:hypothetical protein
MRVTSFVTVLRDLSVRQTAISFSPFSILHACMFCYNTRTGIAVFVSVIFLIDVVVFPLNVHPSSCERREEEMGMRMKVQVVGEEEEEDVSADISCCHSFILVVHCFAFIPFSCFFLSCIRRSALVVLSLVLSLSSPTGPYPGITLSHTLEHSCSERDSCRPEWHILCRKNKEEEERKKIRQKKQNEER